MKRLSNNGLFYTEYGALVAAGNVSFDKSLTFLALGRRSASTVDTAKIARPLNRKTEDCNSTINPIIDWHGLQGNLRTMTTTVKVAANGHMPLPEALCKSRRIKAGMTVRITDAGESILLTPVYPPTEEELTAVIEAAGRPGPAETARSRKQVEAAIERVRARAQKNQRSR